MHAAGFLVALLLRFLPRRLRFRAITRAARLAEPLIARTRAYAERRRMSSDSLRETSLELVMALLTRHRLRFDPVIRVENAELMGRPEEGPMLMVSPHRMLGPVFALHVEESGWRPVAITADAFAYPGADPPATLLVQSPRLLLEVRRHFGDGRTVMAMIDRGELERRSAAYEAGDGSSMFVSDALLRLALRQKARIVFFAAGVDAAGELVCYLGRPSEGSDDLADVIRDFVRFSVATSGGTPDALP